MRQIILLLSLTLLFNASCSSDKEKSTPKADATANTAATDTAATDTTATTGTNEVTTYKGLVNHSSSAVALEGYDVVAYFQNHKAGNKDEGTKGSASQASLYKDVNYYFSSAENKMLFDANPTDYLPAYGGWCAWAMAQGYTRVAVKFDKFIIAPGADGKDKLYLFYDKIFSDTRKDWLKGDHASLVKKADAVWAKELAK